MLDYTLETLLDLDGYIAELGDGFWIKIEARKTKNTSNNKPYGIKYSLTLHDSNGERILGYDNAHHIPGMKSNVPHDHKHKGERTIKYDYESAEKLLEDFWRDVDKILDGRVK